MKRIAFLFVVAFAAVALVASFGCSKKSDPADAMIGHMTSMVKIMKDNKEDCAKVVDELTKYSESHKKDFEELKKAGEEMEKSMSEQEKKDYADKMMKKMGPMLQENMAIMMEVSQKCPEHAAKIGEAMNVMK